MIDDLTIILGSDGRMSTDKHTKWIPNAPELKKMNKNVVYLSYILKNVKKYLTFIKYLKDIVIFTIMYASFKACYTHSPFMVRLA